MNDKEQEQGSNRRVHMANERTFLAWLRTSIAIMAFGFVVERFSLFIREISSVLGKSAGGTPSSHGYASIIGIALVGLGTLIGVMAFFRYRNTERQIDNESSRPSLRLDLVLVIAASVLVTGILLIAYLAYNFVSTKG